MTAAPFLTTSVAAAIFRTVARAAAMLLPKQANKQIAYTNE